MESEHRRIELRLPVDDGREIAATLHLSARVEPRAPLIVGLPGGGYARGYFDLPKAGYSHAAHLTARGIPVLAIDHLGAGESSIPPREASTIEAVSAAGDQAVRRAMEGLRAGAFGVEPIETGAIIACGQSMGGHIAVSIQALHRTFDALIALGSGMHRTHVPEKPGAATPDLPDDLVGEARSAAMVAQIDWPWLFHWEGSAADLVAIDIAAGMPIRHSPPPWGSAGIPGFATRLNRPGTMLPFAAAIDVPVLIGMGERDVTLSPAAELATFTASNDLSAIRIGNMAHMHNFADSRHLLWRRIDAFVDRIASARQ